MPLLWRQLDSFVHLVRTVYILHTGFQPMCSWASQYPWRSRLPPCDHVTRGLSFTGTCYSWHKGTHPWIDFKATCMLYVVNASGALSVPRGRHRKKISSRAFEKSIVRFWDGSYQGMCISRVIYGMYQRWRNAKIILRQQWHTLERYLPKPR